MVTGRYDERWLMVTLVVVQSLLVTLVQCAATGEVSSEAGACSGMKSEAVDICTNCPDVTVSRCCADINVFRRCLATANVTSEDKRARPFLGKRHARPFLGKRDDDGSDISSVEDLAAVEDKRARPFLGKRSEDSQEELDKRARPFLGKRAYDLDLDLQEEEEEKRARPFLGKREQLRNIAYKRPRPFLGKRGGMADGEDSESQVDKRSRARPFLGKRSTDATSSKVRVKRARPFLGKRPRPFLGKRSDTSEERESEMVEYLLRLHPELLNDDVSSQQDKRARPFLG